MSELRRRRYTHERLNNNQNQIRLLEFDSLAGETDNRSINCTISVYDAKQVPSYSAISYTWGDPSASRVISLNGKQFEVSHNCWYALHQARLHCGTTSRLIWMDQICIDQSNDAESQLR